MTGHPEQHQDRADQDDDDADRPDNSDLGDKADDEENYAENNQGRLLVNGGRRPGRRQENIRTFSRKDALPTAGGTRLACSFTGAPTGVTGCGRCGCGRHYGW